MQGSDKGNVLWFLDLHICHSPKDRRRLGNLSAFSLPVIFYCRGTHTKEVCLYIWAQQMMRTHLMLFNCSSDKKIEFPYFNIPHVALTQRYIYFFEILYTHYLLLFSYCNEPNKIPPTMTLSHPNSNQHGIIRCNVQT